MAGWGPGGSDGLPETDADGAPRIRSDQVIRGDVCRYLEVCDDGTVHTSRDLIAHRKDQGDWWDWHLNPITDRVSGRVATYLVRPRRQDPPAARLVFALDVAGTGYSGQGRGWLVAGFEPGRYRAVGEAPVPVRVQYRATEILAWDEADAVVQRHQDHRRCPERLATRVTGGRLPSPQGS